MNPQRIIVLATIAAVTTALVSDQHAASLVSAVTSHPDVLPPQGDYIIESRGFGRAFGKRITYRKHIWKTFAGGVGASAIATVTLASLTGFAPILAGVFLAGSLVTVPMFSMFKANMLELSDKEPGIVFTLKHNRDSSHFTLQAKWKLDDADAKAFVGSNALVDNTQEASRFIAKPGQFYAPTKRLEVYLRIIDTGDWLSAGRHMFIQQSSQLNLSKNKPTQWLLIPQ